MAEPADQSHAVELPGLLLESPDEQHVAEGGKLLFFAEFGHCNKRRIVRQAALGGRLGRLFIAHDGHVAPQNDSPTSVIGLTPLSRNRAKAKAHAGMLWRRGAAATRLNIGPKFRYLARMRCRQRSLIAALAAG